MKVTINPDKSIGKVIYVVEGNVFEPELLKEIFHDILNYFLFMVLRFARRLFPPLNLKAEASPP